MHTMLRRGIICCKRTLVFRNNYNPLKSLPCCSVLINSPYLCLLKVPRTESPSLSPVLSYSFCTATMSTQLEQQLNDPKRHIDYEALLQQQNDQTIAIIDVRQPEELATTGKIPGSINVPLSDLENALKNMSEEEFQAKYHGPRPPKDSKLVFSCQAGRRSLAALSIALTNGYINSAHYRGGWSDWEKHATPQQ